MSIEIKLNGRKMRSFEQLGRELERSIKRDLRSAVLKQAKQVAGPGARVKETRDGFVVEGTAEQVERLKKRLK